MSPVVEGHVPAGDLDLLAVQDVLGEPPVLLGAHDDVPAPWITVDGRIHSSTTYYLRYRCTSNPNMKTASNHALELERWLRYLLVDRRIPPGEGRADPVVVATEQDFAAYYRAAHHGIGPSESTPLLTSGGWTAVRKALKPFYEYMRRRYGVEMPFDVMEVPRHGRMRTAATTMIVGYLPRRGEGSPAGRPLEPVFAQLLLQAALRIDRDGVQKPYLPADRDQAIFALGFATGMRHNVLTYFTTYELPALAPGRPVTVTRVPDLITKNDAGGDAHTISHFLPAVWAYVEGRRSELAEGHRYRPSRPLYIEEADNSSVRYVDPEQRSAGVQTSSWSAMREQDRRRLVKADGTSPIVFLSEKTGAPLAYSSFQKPMEGARKFAISHINSHFPAHFRLHDLRHTYAVHLVMSIFHNIISDSLPEDRRDMYRVDQLSAAVDLVSASLGHTNTRVTKLYLSTAHRFLAVPRSHFEGRF